MRRNPLMRLVGTLVFSVLPVFATPMSSYDPVTFVCNIYENQIVSFGFLAFSGDVIVQNSRSVTVAVFRIFNDFFNSGGGTGIGDGGFLFGANQLPDPSTYSVNAVTISLGPAMDGFDETTFTANGDTYNLFTPVPEPSSMASLGIAAIVAAGSLRRRSQRRIAADVHSFDKPDNWFPISTLLEDKNESHHALPSARNRGLDRFLHLPAVHNRPLNCRTGSP